jgi:hypothetical protein
MQDSLPAGWLAFTGRELNPLDRDEGFQITSSSSLPGLFLAQRLKTCTETDFAHGRSETARCILHLPVDFALVDSEPNLNQIASTLFLFCSRWC